MDRRRDDVAAACGSVRSVGAGLAATRRLWDGLLDHDLDAFARSLSKRRLDDTGTDVGCARTERRFAVKPNDHPFGGRLDELDVPAIGAQEGTQDLLDHRRHGSAHVGEITPASRTATTSRNYGIHPTST